MKQDKLIIGGHEFDSRFILGSGKYSLDLINAAVQNAGAQIITLALRRTNTNDTANILDYIPEGVTLLPNTSGARNAEEAVRIARLAREVGCGDFVKIEVIHDSKYLLPDNYETIKATEILAKEGFVVMPYMYPDLNAARDLVNAGAAAVMPLGSPIGSNKGICTKDFIQILIDEIDLPIIFLTGHGDIDMAVKALLTGATDFIVKPPEPNRLKEALAKAVAKNQNDREAAETSEEMRAQFDLLTPAEKKAAEMIALGKLNKVISFELEVSEQAVKNWRSSIFHKLNCKNIVELNAFLRKIHILND